MLTRFLRRHRGRYAATDPIQTAAPDTGHGIPPGSASGWTEDRIRALGAVTTVPIACAIFAVSPAAAYPKIRADLADGGTRFPVPVLRVGRVYRVPVPAILAVLGSPATSTDDPHPRPADLLDPGHDPVDDWTGPAQSRVDPPSGNPR